MSQIATSGGTSTAGIARGMPGRLLGIVFTNASLAARYLLLWDSATLPQTGDGTPMCTVSHAISATPLILDSRVFGDGVLVQTGLTWAISTAPDTYQAGTASQHTLNLFHGAA